MALKDIIGQDRAVNILVRTISRGRIPSAYIFCGEPGIGKRFTAINLAKAINCLKVTSNKSQVTSNKETVTSNELRVTSKENSTNALLKTRYSSLPLDFSLIDACDECYSCKKIDAMNHPDFILIAPVKGEIRVDEIRAVGDALSFKPYEGRKKVVIIDDADTMNLSAANAFLKTLEEPPDESLMILITANPDRLPETIRSRCSRINFTPLSPEACEKIIQTVNIKGGLGEVVAKLSMGRPGLAISADILKERDRFMDLLRNMINSDNEAWADRDEMEQWLDMALVFLRDVAVLKIVEEGNEGLLLNTDRRDIISGIAKTSDMKGIIESYHKVSLLKGQLNFNLNKAITWNYVSGIIQSSGLKI
ncbi:MAG: DNA polymerase III subunit delta' [Thermodesulfovibrionales bacterium]